jgi:hypothetical protein
MSEVDTYEINPNIDAGFKEKSTSEQSFQERREVFVEHKIEDITTQIASNMRANLNPEIANSPVETPSYENPLSLDILGQYFGNVEINPQEKAPIDIYPYGEFDYRNVDIQELYEDFTAEKLVPVLLWSSAMLKLPVETYESSMDLQNFKITPEIKEEILGYMLKKDNKEVSDVIEVISKQPPENITGEDIEYLVEARKHRGGITKEEVDKEANKVREQIKPLLLENKWENLPPELLSHVLSIGAPKETVELGDLVSDVYPVFERYREDINKALKLAFIDKEKFAKKYVENDEVREKFDRFIFDLRNKAPRLSYKAASALGSMVLIVAACSPMVSGTTEADKPVAVITESSEIPDQRGGDILKLVKDGSIIGSNDFIKENQEIREVQEIEDIINITNWEGYELESIEDIEPTYYTPSRVSKLWVVPLVDLPMDRQIDKDKQILEYQLYPGRLNSLKINKKITISTPDKYKIIIGIPESFIDEHLFHVSFSTLLEVSYPDDTTIVFSTEEKKPDTIQLLREEYLRSNQFSALGMDSLIIPNILYNTNNNDKEVLENFSSITKVDGIQYEFREVKAFTELIHKDSLSDEFIHALLYRYLDSNNKIPPRYWQEEFAEGFSQDELVTHNEMLNSLDRIIELTNWKEYKLESIEEIDPVYYIPNPDSPWGSFLWIIPFKQGTEFFDTDRPTLEYQLFSGKSNSLEITRLFTVSTKDGHRILLGEVDKAYEDTQFDAKLITLLEITDPENNNIKFCLEDKNVDESKKNWDLYKNIISSFGRQKFFFYNRMFTVTNIFHSGFREFNDLLNQYDPSYYLIGKKYESQEIDNFLDIFD